MAKTELLKIAKPILFNTDMVRAILDGRKTVTRRLLKQPFEIHPNGYITKPKGNERLIPYVPPYQPGDIIYVRETWRKHPKQDIFYYRADNVCNGKSDEKGCPEPYDKTNNCVLCEWCDGFIKWCPSIHMPKSAARIFLKVTDVRVERLHDITEEQAIKEGFNSENEFMRDFFKIYPKQHLDWLFNDEDLWVWVYEFERVECDERK